MKRPSLEIDGSHALSPGTPPSSVRLTSFVDPFFANGMFNAPNGVPTSMLPVSE